MSRTHDVTISAFDLDRLERELATVTEQRDRAQSKIENQAERIKYLEGATNHATGTPLSKMREQRDRLAEEIENLKSNLTWNITETNQ
jgi:septation ring formation regulator EzrA